MFANIALKPVSGRTTVELYDLAHIDSGRISCFCNLGHPSHLLIFKHNMNLRGLISVEYRGNDVPQHVFIESLNAKLCLSAPGESVMPMKVRYPNAQFSPLQVGGDYEVLHSQLLSVRVGVEKIDTAYDRRVGDRISILRLYFDLKYE